MRFLGLSSSIIGLSLLVAGCTTTAPKMTKEKLLSNVRQAVDPQGKLKQAKTQLIVCKVERAGDKPAKLVIKVKYPDKLKRMLVIPGKGVRIEAYNGKIGWTYSTAGGIKQVHGKALDELRLQTAMAVNRGNLKKVFKTIEFKGKAEIANNHCYKIVAQPKDIYKSQPITFYINKSTFLPQAKEEIFDTTTQSFPVVTVLGDYQNDCGMNIPMSRVIDMNGTLLDLTVISVEWDVYIDDSEFEPPVKLK